jgi:aspartyl-tRNA(Asn)/glutamyl-tRNA(Gln) amidotransferase subunit C
MALNEQDIARIANLARLELSQDESKQTLAQLNSFFGIVEKMQAVDTSGVTPLSHPLAAIEDVVLRLREDRVAESDDRDANMRNAPAAEGGMFLVPKVIE